MDKRQRATRAFVMQEKALIPIMPATKQWQQTWVDNAGGSNEYLLGKFEDNKIIYSSSPFPFSKDTMAIRKMTFTNLGPLNSDSMAKSQKIMAVPGPLNMIWNTEEKNETSNILIMLLSACCFLRDVKA